MKIKIERTDDGIFYAQPENVESKYWSTPNETIGEFKHRIQKAFPAHKIEWQQVEKIQAEFLPLPHEHGKVRLSDFVQKFATYLQERGDKYIEYRVKDAYSIYGNLADVIMGTKFWDGTFTNDDWLRIDVSLQYKDGKLPKITFRKQ